MSVRRHLPAVAVSALLAVGVLAEPASALVPADEAAGTYAMSLGRLMSTVGGVLGLVAVVIGSASLVRAFRRSGPGSGRRGAFVALGLALVGAVLAGITAATADGGIGTGNGLAGAYVAITLSLVGAALAGSALVVRSRRAA